MTTLHAVISLADLCYAWKCWGVYCPDLIELIQIELL